MFHPRKHLLIAPLAIIMLLACTVGAQAHFGPFIHPFIHPYWGGFGFGPRFVPPYYPPFFPFYFPPPLYVPPYRYYYRPITYTPTFTVTPSYGLSPSGYTLTTQPAMPDEQKEPAYQGKTVKEWIKSLKNWDSHMRGQAANALAQLGPKARDAIPDLVNALKDSDPMVRIEAAAALAAIGADAVKPLIEALKNSDKYVRMGAAVALGILGPKAKKDGADALRAALKDKDVRVRCHAAQALWRVARDAKAATPQRRWAASGRTPKAPCRR